MEIRQIAVVLLLALYSTLSADAQPAEVRHRYINFLEQHVFGNMNAGRCDTVIRDRHITEGNTNNCKKVNTFILATHEQVRAVCQQGGTHRGGNLYESTNPFLVVICKLRGGERHPKCVYRGAESTRIITLGCAQGWPVHYEEDTLIIG